MTQFTLQAPTSKTDLGSKLTAWTASGSGRGWLTAAGLYVLFGIAFNFAAPFRLAWGAMVFIAQHPSLDWFMFRVLCMGVLVACMMYLGSVIEGLFKAKASSGSFAVSDPTADHGNGYGRYAVEDFREQSPYGDANLAKKREIARALVGQAVTHTPKFEE